MRNDHRDGRVGPWASIKLDALEAYLKHYNIALKKAPFRRVYIDAFAGLPYARVRPSDRTARPEVNIFSEDEDATAQAEFIRGSPLRALGIDPGFHVHYFFDQDEARVAELQALKAQHPTKDIHVKLGDANQLVRHVVSRMGRWDKVVAFLDPYGAHVEWGTIEALARTGNAEIIINFPLGMAINRQIGKSGQVIAEDQITRCFGTEDWRTRAYTRSTDLFGDPSDTKEASAADALLDLYLSRLEEVFGFVATPRLVRNTRKSPLYYLIWAGPKKIGHGIADHILGQGEKVAWTRVPKKR